MKEIEKSFMDTNQLILASFKTIGEKWNPRIVDDKVDIKSLLKIESVEKLEKLDEINKGIEEIKQHLEKIKSDHKNHDMYAKYFQKMNDVYKKATEKLEKANELKKQSINKKNSLEVALAYLAPLLYFTSEISDYSVIDNEKSFFSGKLGEYYHNKALVLGEKLEFRAIPNIVYAKNFFLESWQKNPQNYESAHGFAKCLYNLSKHNYCIDFLTNEFKKDEQKKSIHKYFLILASCYRKKGDYKKAQETIAHGLKQTPDDKDTIKESELIAKLIAKKEKEPYKDALFSKESEKSKYNEQDFVHRHTESNEFRILSVDGGGIRGIIPAYWACEIEKRAHKPISHLFNMLAGTSTGGIVAAGLSFPNADGFTPKFAAYELLDIYRHKGGEIFPHHNWFTEKLEVVKSVVGSRYREEGRLRLFEALVGEDSRMPGSKIPARISSALTELVITAANETCILSTHLFNRFDAKYDEYFNDTFVDALMCTSAAPYYFPSHKISNKGLFVDGGVHANNPADVAFTEANRYGIDFKDISIVSMGTGAYVPRMLDETSWRSRLFSDDHLRKNRGALYWAAHLKDVALEAQIGNTDISLGINLKEKYQRMQVWFEDAITLDQVDESNVTLLTDIASQYVEEETDSINKLVERLDKGF